MAVKQFAFCESVNATGMSPWHIRKLTSQGFKFGGGADTKALCGKDVCWDLEVDITKHHLGHSCSKCVEVFNGKD